MSKSSTTTNIEIVDSEHQSLVKIDSATGHWDEYSLSKASNELDSKNISQFNHWLNSLPATATAAAGNSPQLMTCSIDFNRLTQARDGSGALGSVIDPETNKFVAQARFHEAENLKNIVNANLIFNLASQILAQKHLADINERLHAIEKKIDSISSHLQESRFSKIEEFQEHLQIVGKLINSGENIDKISLQNISKSVHEVRSEVNHIKKNIMQSHQEINSFDPASIFGSNDIRDALNEKINNIDRLQREYFIGMQCLIIANLILFIKLKGNSEFAIASEVYINELNDESGVSYSWEKCKRTISRHLNVMKPFFERTISTEANVTIVKNRLNKTNIIFETEKSQLLQLNNRIQEAKTPTILLETINGEVKRGLYLSS
ncbi:hypothetical protein [Aeromonas enteropelogenes]|uniref:hypothetical protein n=1 Tax=Aeromonas enteropelogenes TaxID=29489 RepID=UPI003BA22676